MKVSVVISSFQENNIFSWKTMMSQKGVYKIIKDPSVDNDAVYQYDILELIFISHGDGTTLPVMVGGPKQFCNTCSYYDNLFQRRLFEKVKGDVTIILTN